METKVCVIGAGTMGSGIALAAAQNGFSTILFDINEAVLDNAIVQVHSNLDFLVNKQKISVEEKTTILQRIHFTAIVEECIADVIIEAIVEKLAAKESILTRLAAINSPSTIMASNTSSLSITAIQENIIHPERIAGMHFFNPAHVMKLVEVVKGKHTSAETIAAISTLCIQMKKTPVVCKDAPGFIVNRVARHYYLEAMKLVEAGIADFETVDAAMENAGFKMGPFKLMDLIGMDINLAVSQSLYDAFEQAPRFKPSNLQIEKVLNKELGRKTGKGFYDYN